LNIYYYNTTQPLITKRTMPLTFGFKSFNNLDYMKTDARANIVMAISAFVAKDDIKLTNQLLKA
jgi:hypothetical protein